MIAPRQTPFWKKAAPLFVGALVVAVVMFSLREIASSSRRGSGRFPLEAIPDLPVLTAWPEAFLVRLERAYRMIPRSETRVEGLGELGRLYHANGFAAEARACYLGLAYLEPANPLWPYLLAVLGEDFADQSSVVEHLLAAARYDERNRALFSRLGTAYLKLGQLEEARRSFERSLALEEGDLWARLGLARVAVAEEEWSAAERLLRDAVRREPRFSAGHEVLAEVFLEQGKYELARESRQRAAALEAYPAASDPAVDALGAYRFDQGGESAEELLGLGLSQMEVAPRAGAASLERYVELEPDDPEVRLALGLFYVSEGESLKAIPHLEALLKLEPENAEALAALKNAWERVPQEAP